MTFWSGIVAAEKKLEKVDYYELLGVDKTASAGEIEERYYSLASRFHPDRFAASGNATGLAALTRIYARVGEAKNILLNANARREYDRGLAVGVIRIREVSPKTRALSQQDPTNPMAQSLLAKATEAESAGELKSAIANLQLALQFEASSSTLQLRLESVREKIAEAEAVAEKMAAARRPKVTPNPAPAKIAVTPNPAPAKVEAAIPPQSTLKPIPAKVAAANPPNSTPKPVPAKMAVTPNPAPVKVAAAIPPQSTLKPTPAKVAAAKRPKSTPNPAPAKVAAAKRPNSTPNPAPAKVAAAKRPDSTPKPVLAKIAVTKRPRARPKPVPAKETVKRPNSTLKPVLAKIAVTKRPRSIRKPVPEIVVAVKRAKATPRPIPAKMAVTPNPIPASTTGAPDSSGEGTLTFDEVTGELTLKRSEPIVLSPDKGAGAITVQKTEAMELSLDDEVRTLTLEKPVQPEVIHEEGTGALTIKRGEPVELLPDEGIDSQTLRNSEPVPAPKELKPQLKKEAGSVPPVESQLDDDWDFELPDAEPDESEPATLEPIALGTSDKLDLPQTESVAVEPEPEVVALQPSDSPFSLGELVGEYLRLSPLPAHSILGIDAKANPAHARAAYEELVRLYHPHNNDAAGNPERMNVCRDLVGIVVKAYKEL